MNASDPFNPEQLDRVLNAVEGVRHKLPEGALRALAQEVIERVAKQRPATSVAPEGEIATLCKALLSDDRQAAADFILHAEARGIGHDVLCLSYLAVAASRLGAMWDRDEVSFLQVTVAVGRIYALMRSLRRSMPLPPLNTGRSATFVSVPGEDHTLGVAMAAELLRTKGWDVHLLLGLGHNKLVDELAATPPRLLGISTGGKRSLLSLTRLLVALKISMPEMRILVCGQIDPADVDLIGISGADSVALSFDAAEAEMERLAALSTL
ncbi:cobalamin B12-binding domain-containing protein [Paragemmobacter straminiformis]|uniref:Cobalamin B12-binding domain-containing protein n=1 Tax=Paragemmobacter straminiformis TaxID=2045119 RepID=A0A842I5B3_9RHOB|nr:cobalamin-dependent protein [Gemmobacter straminiformis]MBC2834735.1 cobalamin B12-binding domain-containing protein [Gemmobacter straminiformis]